MTVPGRTCADPAAADRYVWRLNRQRGINVGQGTQVCVNESVKRGGHDAIPQVHRQARRRKVDMFALEVDFVELAEAGRRKEEMWRAELSMNALARQPSAQRCYRNIQ